MQFIADNMLGKLAKWLRLMGHDTLYPKDMDDKELIELSKRENRILLTRDKELARSKGIDVLYIEDPYLETQLKQIISKFNLTSTGLEFTRCPECNEIVHSIEKSKVVDKVPKGVFENQDEFWLCNSCNQYYWQGTHYTKILATMTKLYEK
jgi:uncharacterized protein with PIN domain